jgi:hypothetical protein
MEIFIILTIITFIFIIIELKKNRSQIKKIESGINNYFEFEGKITLLSMNPDDLIKYLQLREKHCTENLSMKIMQKNEVDKIDKEALLKRQKQEIENLINKDRKSPYISFPAKK